MTTLIANIGTSDLAIKIDEYYIPIGFDREEPNLDASNLNAEEKLLWERDLRQEYIIEELCEELNVTVTKNQAGKQFFSFRELTEKLLAAYEENESYWHHRISPGRIQGVVNTAQKQFGSKFAYIFITDQPNKHQNDSLYLFKILEKWFDKEMEFKLVPKYLPSDISPIDQDQLLDFYYHFFRQQIPNEEVVLVSIKGGTHQMQTALRLQAVSSTIPKQLFIDPQLSVKSILNGQPSQCQLTAYWKYMRNQKYQTAQQLLERWDFDGASKILRDWQQVLNFLIDQNVLNQREIQKSRNLVHLVTHGLETARSLFNLDVEGAREIISKHNELRENNQFRLSEFVATNSYDSLLNLYTQCCIYYQLSQIANFLARVGSFYESIIYRLINKMGGNKYLNYWKLNSNQFRKDVGDSLFQEFKQLEGRSWLEPQHNIKFSRYSKRNYVDILIKYRSYNNPQLQMDLDNWLHDEFQLSEGRLKGILGLLKSLDYWIEKRNELVHNAEGISQQRIQQFNKQRDQEDCVFEDITRILSKILSNRLVALDKTYRQAFVEENHYYIYSNAKESAIALLMDDATNN